MGVRRVGGWRGSMMGEGGGETFKFVEKIGFHDLAMSDSCPGSSPVRDFGAVWWLVRWRDFYGEGF